MLVDEIKRAAAAAVKAQDTVARDILRLALGEIQTAEARQENALDEEAARAILRKLIKSNEDTLAIATRESSGDDRIGTLRREIEVLAALLPAELTVDQVVAALAPVADGIRGAKADGQATGIAMKHLKAQGTTVSGATVALAVKELRK